jgi:hypothetical protein
LIFLCFFATKKLASPLKFGKILFIFSLKTEAFMLMTGKYGEMIQTLKPYFIDVDEPYLDTAIYVRLADNAREQIKPLFKTFIKIQMEINQSGVD